MSDILNPPTPPASTNAGDDKADSNPVRQLREALDAQKAENKKLTEEFAAFKAEIEKQQLSEVDRLKAEAEQGKQAAARAQKAEGKLTEAYDAQLASLPEDKRAAIKELTFVEGDPAASVDKLRAALAVLPPPTAPAGTVTHPAAGQPPAGAAPVNTFDPKNPPSLSAYFNTHPVRTSSQA